VGKRRHLNYGIRLLLTRTLGRVAWRNKSKGKGERFAPAGHGIGEARVSQGGNLAPSLPCSAALWIRGRKGLEEAHERDAPPRIEQKIRTNTGRRHRITYAPPENSSTGRTAKLRAQGEKREEGGRDGGKFWREKSTQWPPHKN